MNAVTKAEQTALTLPERAAVALGAADYEVKIKAKVAASTDITAVIDPAGREQAHRIGMDLLKLRTGITAAGEAARKDATAFSKAVIAKEKELVGLITPEETRVMTLRDGWDEKIAAEKAAKIAAERARTDAIEARIQAIRNVPLAVVGKSSADILAARDAVRDTIISEELFGEQSYRDKAMEARSDAFNALEAALDVAEKAEAAALAAEEARKAEVARIEQERQEVAKLRADAERVANEQAAERQRLANLAAAQEAEARRISEQAAANLKADRDAQELAMRLQREKAAKEQAERDQAAAEQQRQLAAQQAEFEAKRAAFAREQEEAAARVEAAVRLAADHVDALLDNAQFDADREAERIRLQSLADQHLTDKRDLPRPESATERDAMLDAGVVEVSDNDIINVVMWEFDWSNDEATKRMKAIDYAAAWQERLAEQAE